MHHRIGSTHRHSRRLRVLIAIAILLSASAVGAGGQTAGQPVLTLGALLDSVRATHPSARAAESMVRAAEGSRITAGSFGNPTLSYQVDQTPFPGGRPLSDMQRETMIMATLPLESLFQRGPRVARADANVRAAEADAFATRQQLGLDAAAAFYHTGVAQLQTQTTEELVTWLDSLVNYNRSRVKEGVAAEADLIRAELERDRVASEASMQEADLAQARAELGAFVSSAVPLLVVAVADRPFPMQPAIVSRSDSAPGGAALLAQRPDIRAARERLAASRDAVSAERSMILREVGATIGSMRTMGTTSMIAGVSLPFPLFDQNRGEIHRAGAEREVAAYELAARERSASADLLGAYDAARILTARAILLARGDSTSFLRHAEESRQIALGAYREGAVPLFQVIDAARAWAEARMTYYRVIVAQHQSILALLVAEGRDLFTTMPALSNAGAP